jgi:hypothetical protein
MGYTPEQATELLNKSVETLKEKERTRLQQKDFIESLANLLVDAEKSDVKFAADLLYYMGRYETPITRNREIQYPDKITVVLEKLVEIIRTLGLFGKLDLLSPYLSALAAAGITVKVNSEQFPMDQKLFDPEAQKTADKIFESSKDCQAAICKLQDEIKDEDAARAKEIEFVKSGYPGIVKLDYDKISGKLDVEKKATEKTKDLSMSLNAIDFVMKESQSA